MAAVSVVRCDAAKREWVEGFSREINPNGPTFAYSASSMPRHWHLGVFRDTEAVFGMAVVRRGSKVTDLEFKLHVAAFRKLAFPIPIGRLSDYLKDHSDTMRWNGLVSEARGRRLREAIEHLGVEASFVLEEFDAWIEGQSLPGPEGEQLGMEKDAIGTLFEVAGFDRSFLTRWIDRGDRAFIDGLPLNYKPQSKSAQITDPSGVYRLITPENKRHVADRIRHVERIEIDAVAAPREEAIPESPQWINEDQIIMFDYQRFSDWLGLDGEHIGWRKYQNTANTQNILVYYANRTSIESTLGVDLLYFNERYGCYVLVQYKKMSLETGAGEWRYRPDKNLRRELERMRKIDDRCRDSELQNKVLDFRMLPSPCFVKLCEANSLVNSSSEWVKGMYLPREQFETVLSAKSSKGPRGGICVTYSNVERYLNTTTFTTLLKDGWIGSRGVGTELIRSVVNESLSTGRAIMIGVHAGSKPMGNGKVRGSRRQESLKN